MASTAAAAAIFSSLTLPKSRTSEKDSSIENAIAKFYSISHSPKHTLSLSLDMPLSVSVSVCLSFPISDDIDLRKLFLMAAVSPKMVLLGNLFSHLLFAAYSIPENTVLNLMPRSLRKIPPLSLQISPTPTNSSAKI